jgi:hypothetical protein
MAACAQDDRLRKTTGNAGMIGTTTVSRAARDPLMRIPLVADMYPTRRARIHVWFIQVIRYFEFVL